MLPKPPRLSAARRHLRAALACTVLLGALAGCVLPANQPRNGQTPTAEQIAQTRRERFRARPPVNTTQNLYEGSLWRGPSSWGNLLRDHRARYPGDLLTINEVQQIVNVPEPAPEQPQAQPAAAEQEEQEPAPEDPVLRFLREQERRREEIEREQNEILRSIDQIEVEVRKVLPNGNMVVRGVHPPIYRDRNRVKYVITLEGVVRPAEVDENNTVPATKLSQANLRIHRLVKVQRPPLGQVARAAGQEEAGNVLDRITDLLTAPGTGSGTTNVSPR